MPRKTFTAGEVLLASDVNTFLSNEAVLTSSTVTAYTAVADDRYKTLVFTSGSPVTVTIGTATAFQAGERVDILQDGAGLLTVSAGTTVTLSGRGTSVTSYTVGQRHDAVTVLCVDTNSYRIIGNATAV
jgi:hypothetical protein